MTFENVKEGDILYTKDGVEVFVIDYRGDYGRYPLFVRYLGKPICLTEDGKMYAMDKKPFVYETPPLPQEEVESNKNLYNILKYMENKINNLTKEVEHFKSFEKKVSEKEEIIKILIDGYNFISNNTFIPEDAEKSLIDVKVDDIGEEIMELRGELEERESFHDIMDTLEYHCLMCDKRLTFDCSICDFNKYNKVMV